MKASSLVSMCPPSCEKLLGVKSDHILTIDDHISKLCKKATRKISALSRVTPYMNLSKKRILPNAFFNSQFSYCSLVWMFHSRANYCKINRLHERCLKIIHFDKQSLYKSCWKYIYSSVSIRNRNLQILATEMYKISKGFSPPIIMELFKTRDKQHNLRNNTEITIPVVRTFYHWAESISFLGLKICNTLPDRLKNTKSR